MFYSYSDEIVRSSPFSVWKLNYELPFIQKIIRQQQLANRKLIKNYEPLYGARVFHGKYVSGDGAAVPFFMVDTVRTAEKAPCLLYYHGEDFITPVTPQILNIASYFAAKCGMRILIPDYRRSLDYPCSKTLEDCYSMLLFAEKHADRLGIDMEHMIFYGDSAGAALCAGMTLMTRDKGGPVPLAQMLIYPALDYHDPEKYMSMRQYRHAPWSASANLHMWQIYLSKGDTDMYPYAVPMSHPDHSKLPPAYIEPQEIDVLRDEGIAYARKLEEEGNQVRLNIVMGTYHGFDFDHTSSLVQRVLKERAEYIRSVLS